MTKALLIALTIAVVGMSARSAEAGYRYWGGSGVYEEPTYCGYDVRRRGYPSETEYYFVYRCFAPEESVPYRPHRKVLRSRG